MPAGICKASVRIGHQFAIESLKAYSLSKGVVSTAIRLSAFLLTSVCVSSESAAKMLYSNLIGWAFALQQALRAPLESSNLLMSLQPWGSRAGGRWELFDSAL